MYSKKKKEIENLVNEINVALNIEQSKSLDFMYSG